MKTEKEIEEAIKEIQDMINKEVYRGLQSEEGKASWLDRIKTLRWVLE
ncbi:MAG: hypothetical protein ACOYWZ_14185 [Bacillota bacterium]